MTHFRRCSQILIDCLDLHKQPDTMISLDHSVLLTMNKENRSTDICNPIDIDEPISNSQTDISTYKVTNHLS